MLFKAHRFYFVCCGRHHAHKKFHKKFQNGLTDTFSDLGFLAASIRKLPSLKTVLVPYIEITCCNILYKICSQQHTKWNPWTLINNWQQLLIKDKWVYIFKFVPQNWKLSSMERVSFISLWNYFMKNFICKMWTTTCKMKCMNLSWQWQ